MLTIIIIGTEKSLLVLIRDGEDYLKKAYKQREDREVYKENPNKPNFLVNTIIKAIEKIWLCGDLSSDTLNYIFAEDPKFGFFLLPKIHKGLHNVPGRSAILNCYFYIGNISSFLDYHLQPLAWKIKSLVA